MYPNTMRMTDKTWNHISPGRRRPAEDEPRRKGYSDEHPDRPEQVPTTGLKATLICLRPVWVKLPPALRTSRLWQAVEDVAAAEAALVIGF